MSQRIKIKVIKELYNKAKTAKVGEKVCCPSCRTEFEKTNYQQAFCKSKGGTVCKDYYWNYVTPDKRNNTTRISPASARYMALNDTPVVLGFGDSQRAIDKADRLEIELNSGDGMDVTVDRCEWCECLICRCDS